MPPPPSLFDSSDNDGLTSATGDSFGDRDWQQCLLWAGGELPAEKVAILQRRAAAEPDLAAKMEEAFEVSAMLRSAAEETISSSSIDRAAGRTRSLVRQFAEQPEAVRRGRELQEGQHWATLRLPTGRLPAAVAIAATVVLGLAVWMSQQQTTYLPNNTVALNLDQTVEPGEITDPVDDLQTTDRDLRNDRDDASDGRDDATRVDSRDERQFPNNRRGGRVGARAMTEQLPMAEPLPTSPADISAEQLAAMFDISLDEAEDALAGGGSSFAMLDSRLDSLRQVGSGDDLELLDFSKIELAEVDR